jgi:hypothetical protein
MLFGELISGRIRKEKDIMKGKGLTMDRQGVSILLIFGRDQSESETADRVAPKCQGGGNRPNHLSATRSKS